MNTTSDCSARQMTENMKQLDPSSKSRGTSSSRPQCHLHQIHRIRVSTDSRVSSSNDVASPRCSSNGFSWSHRGDPRTECKAWRDTRCFGARHGKSPREASNELCFCAWSGGQPLNTHTSTMFSPIFIPKQICLREGGVRMYVRGVFAKGSQGFVLAPVHSIKDMHENTAFAKCLRNETL